MNRAMIRRLERAVEKKDKFSLIQWITELDEEIRSDYKIEFKKELSEAIDNYLIAIIYTLHYSEITRFGNKRIKEMIKDIVATVDLFNSKEYTPDDYVELLEKDGITINLRKEKK